MNGLAKCQLQNLQIFSNSPELSTKRMTFWWNIDEILPSFHKTFTGCILSFCFACIACGYVREKQKQKITWPPASWAADPNITCGGDRKGPLLDTKRRIQRLRGRLMHSGFLQFYANFKRRPYDFRDFNILTDWGMSTYFWEIAIFQGPSSCNANLIIHRHAKLVEFWIILCQ